MANKISQSTVDSILSAARIEDVVESFYDLKKAGSNSYCKCPFCDAEGKGKGLQVTKSKGIYKCFTCGKGGKSPINFLMDTQMMKYPEALKWLADKYNITIEQDTEEKKRGPQRRTGNMAPSFRDRQLQASGLTDEDQRALVVDDEHEGTWREVDVFEAATRSDDGRIVEGDDMLIWYFDLNGKPIEYQVPKSTRTAKLWRIRWQIPDLHKDKNGRAMKYTSPYGSGSHLFIPQIVRNAYKDARVITRLYIQEGEKKSVKACKHGIFSVGIMGIQNIGSGGKLPYDLQLLVQRCQIKEVVFLLDSDYDHLSTEIKPGTRVDLRPLSFFYAVKSFREYFKAFSNTGNYLEIYFGHIKDNESNDKGIDDLLANTLKGNEDSLKKDIDSAINNKDGRGDYVAVHKISTIPDLKLMEYWNLHSVDEFAKKYKDRLKDLQEFQFGKHKWKFENDKLVPAQPLQEDEQYWIKEEKEARGGATFTTYRFKYMYCYNFLQRRGFNRYRQLNNSDCFVFIKDKLVEVIDSYYMRDFVTEFTKEIAEKSELVEVMDMLYRGGKMYLGPDSLSNLSYVTPHFEVADKSFQYIYFKEKVWKITASGIEERNYSELEHHVWREKVINMDVSHVKGTYSKETGVKSNSFIEIDRITDELINKYKNDSSISAYKGQYLLTFSEEASQCHFAKFVWNTSEFFWRKFIDPETRKYTQDERTLDERFETTLHFVSKMTAIGYLIHKYRDKSVEKAVIAMDGKLSEVGESNGRTGKSIIGAAIGKVIPQAYIGAKSKELTSDPFIWEEVTEKTENVFLDDVRANIDFEFFFPVITGQMTVNMKGQKKFTLPEEKTPKIYMTTNHALNGSSPSFLDRQFLIAFSDYYNDDYKPLDDFGINFFNEWDQNQWNLFYNFIAACLQLYFKAQQLGWGVNRSGLIPSPTERLDRRRMRQFLGENFLTWADEYYSVSDDPDQDPTTMNNNLNQQISRKELFDNYLDRNPNDRKYVTPHHFKKKIKAWCKYRRLIFNPHKRDSYGHPGGDDKSGGIEYFMIGNSDVTGYGG
jgi:hypothetical protein